MPLKHNVQQFTKVLFSTLTTLGLKDKLKGHTEEPVKMTVTKCLVLNPLLSFKTHISLINTYSECLLDSDSMSYKYALKCF